MSEQVDLVAQLRVIHFFQRRIAEVKGRFEGRYQLVLPVRLLQFRLLGSGSFRQRRAQVSIRFADVHHQVSKTHLLRGGLIAELFGGHLLDRRGQVLLLPRKNLAHSGGDGILGLLGKCSQRNKKKAAS